MQAHQRQPETAFVAVIRSSVSSGLRAIKRPQTRAIKLRQHAAAAILRVATAIQQFHSSELSCCTFSLRVRARAPCKHGPLNLNGRRASRLTLKYAAQCYSQRPERVEPAAAAAASTTSNEIYLVGPCKLRQATDLVAWPSVSTHRDPWRLARCHNNRRRVRTAPNLNQKSMDSQALCMPPP